MNTTRLSLRLSTLMRLRWLVALGLAVSLTLLMLYLLVPGLLRPVAPPAARELALRLVMPMPARDGTSAAMSKPADPRYAARSNDDPPPWTHPAVPRPVQRPAPPPTTAITTPNSAETASLPAADTSESAEPNHGGSPNGVAATVPGASHLAGTGAGAPEKALSDGEPADCQERVKPHFPDTARDDGIAQGRVLARLLLNTDGSVRQVVILNAKPTGYFEQAVRAAAIRWHCTAGFASIRVPFELNAN